MIILPENVIDYIMVDHQNQRLLVHLVNEHRQYVLLHHRIDKALSLDEQCNALLLEDFSNTKAYVITENMETEWTEPTDQLWVPAPITAEGVLTLKQYKAMGAKGA